MLYLIFHEFLIISRLFFSRLLKLTLYLPKANPLLLEWAIIVLKLNILIAKIYQELSYLTKYYKLDSVFYLDYYRLSIVYLGPNIWWNFSCFSLNLFIWTFRSLNILKNLLFLFLRITFDTFLHIYLKSNKLNYCLWIFISKMEVHTIWHINSIT